MWAKYLSLKIIKTAGQQWKRAWFPRLTHYGQNKYTFTAHTKKTHSSLMLLTLPLATDAGGWSFAAAPLGCGACCESAQWWLKQSGFGLHVSPNEECGRALLRHRSPQESTWPALTEVLQRLHSARAPRQEQLVILLTRRAAGMMLRLKRNKRCRPIISGTNMTDANLHIYN